MRPDSNITRAEVATIIYRLLTEETRAFYFTKVNTFSDVVSTDWFNDPVSTLARASVLNGYEDGTFHPNSFITRAELATILETCQGVFSDPPDEFLVAVPVGEPVEYVGGASDADRNRALFDKSQIKRQHRAEEQR